MLVIPGCPAVDGLTWWVLSEGGIAPEISLRGPNSPGADIVTHSLARPGDGASSRNAFLVATTNLNQDTAYDLTARLPAGASATATSHTFPGRIGAQQSFTIALDSCYCWATDVGLAGSYPPARFNQLDPIRLRFHVGDQLYMDLTPYSGDAIIIGQPDPWARYPEMWQKESYGCFLSTSPNIMLADDHEYWNDYPHSNVWLLWDEDRPGGPLGQKMDRAFSVFQAALNLRPSDVQDNNGAIDARLSDAARTFDLVVEPLRFFLLDTRTRRMRFDDPAPHFAPEPWLDKAVTWLRNLPGPGVLILSQPLVEKRASEFNRFFRTMTDVNLPDYDLDFATLWDAVFTAPHDVLVLSGDIHWSRLYRLYRPVSPNGRQIFELISSPLSRIPSSAPGLGQDAGEVEWKSTPGLAYWNKLYATNVSLTYTTATFRPTSSVTGGTVEVEVNVWGKAPYANAGAELLHTRSITLE